ncbi:D-isomer specific 2-hydroxyacid dehydrogenase [Emericellopsis atlantica]|uniref:D-isomer specific 2-hydroxyacid dehydrogenase n=1 Tax=Emericellopsis atlantica TaxID=2614577 RepID=A0A9P8CQE2_9HYPO|nr:D-isomer specific 2-hydroxyacid dehydrogenase [Emericellopsis atlantica]KAG9255538.1 D-isomer specific 2-hydroxyacid dehydrogenase [Emericellopsis atlantica]
MANPTLKGHKLLVLNPFPTPASSFDPLKETFPDLAIQHVAVDFHEGDAHAKVSDEEWSNVTILMTGSALPKIEKAPKLQVVQLQSAGSNHVHEKPLYKETDVTFCTANGVHGPQIAEWVIATFLAHQHHIPAYLETQKQARWARQAEMPDDAVGKRIGILGYGAIGRQTARVAQAMGMDVHAYTLHPKDTPEARRDATYVPEGLGDPEGLLPRKWFSGTTKEDLHAFLGSDLDLLVIAVPLTPVTRHLIGEEEFAILGKKRTFVSNIARGPVIKTDDLVEALNSGTIRGAALDVTDPEPLTDGHPLWSAKNVIITPHISGMSSKLAERVLGVLRQNLTNLSQGADLVNRVNRKEGY